MPKPSRQTDLEPAETTSIDWSRFVALVKKNRRFILTAHVRPDCDAVGSELGMAIALERLGKDVRIVNPFDVPPNLQFIDPQGRCNRLGSDASQQWIDEADVLMVLDTCAWVQLGDMADVIRRFSGTVMVLDHHASQDDLGPNIFQNSSAEATGRLVAEAAEQLGIELTREIARPLFAAIATDTGWFRFSSTSSYTYRLAAKLVDGGVEPDLVYQDLYENDSHARLRLMGRAMQRTETELDGRLIHTWIDRVDFDATGALPSHTENLVNLQMSIGGTEVALIFLEQPGGGYKVSFRSRSGVDCNRVAAKFGGGGHKKAAGAFVDEPLFLARPKVLDAVLSAM